MFGFTLAPSASTQPHSTPDAHAALRRPARTLFAACVIACLCCLPLAALFMRGARAQSSGASAASRSVVRRLDAGEAAEVLIRNTRGQVRVTTSTESDPERTIVAEATATSGTLSENDIAATREGGRVSVGVAEAGAETNGRSAARVPRVDLVVRVPARARVTVETTEGAVDVAGDFRRVAARTTTGTIRVDVPSTNLRYDLRWTAARPRVYSLLPLAAPRESSGGRFSINGRFPAKNDKRAASSDDDGNATDDADDGETEQGDDKKSRERERRKREREQQVELELTTARGIVVLGAELSIVPSDLRERTLTEAARVFIRSGDEYLIEPVRRLAPNLVDEYAGTLRTRRAGAPVLRQTSATSADAADRDAERITAVVTDRQNRPLTGLNASDFLVTVGGAEREVLSVTPSEAPFNLVLLLDVSGSVEERLDFIRRAALRFALTAGKQDRIAVVTFRDDVRKVSDFTADRAELASRINTIEAGGATALYDALAYTLLDVLPTLPAQERERACVVVLSDGDDNRSFLALRNVLDLTREVGSPIYPLYVPSGLIPASDDKAAAPSAPVSSAAAADPLRARSLTLTTNAAAEGARLARDTGGVFYPVARLEDLQRAYDDIVRQLRASYTITYRARPQGTSDLAPAGGELRVRVRRPDAVVARTIE